MKRKVGIIVMLLAVLALVATSAPLANTDSAMAAPDSDMWEAVPLPASLPLGATLDDVMPSPDGGTLFLSTTDSGSKASTLWRSSVPATATSWMAVSTADTLVWIIRLSPDYTDDSALYWCDLGGTDIMRSVDGGETFASRVATATITDVAVEDSHTLYLASASDVYKSTNGGVVWGPPVNANVGTTFMIAVAPTYPNPPVLGNILVGGTGGNASYSIDGGASFMPLLPSLLVGGNVQIAGDENYATNNTVYAGSSNGGVYRWQIGLRTAWEQINSTTITNVSGLVVSNSNLYAADATPGGGAYRIINNPAHLIDGLSGGETFAQVPNALRCSPDTLFAIDIINNLLYRYTISMGLFISIPVPTPVVVTVCIVVLVVLVVTGIRWSQQKKNRCKNLKKKLKECNKKRTRVGRWLCKVGVGIALAACLLLFGGDP